MNPINLITNLWLLSFKFFSHIRSTTQRSVIHYRFFKTINIDNFKSDILSSPLYTNPASNSSDLSEQLSSTLNSILDIHAPLKSEIVVLRPHTPWINPEIIVAKRDGREVDSNDQGVAGNLPLTARNSEPNAILSDLKSQIQFSHKSCHWIILQPSHTFENFKFNSPSQPIQFIPLHTRHTITCQFIPPMF